MSLTNDFYIEVSEAEFNAMDQEQKELQCKRAKIYYEFERDLLIDDYKIQELYGEDYE